LEHRCFAEAALSYKLRKFHLGRYSLAQYRVLSDTYQAPKGTEYQHRLIQVDGTDMQELATPFELIGGHAGPPGKHDIYLPAGDGTELYRLTNSRNNLASPFSPDGNWLVFPTSRDGDNETNCLSCAWMLLE
jgi:hypothetical protein